MQSNPQLVEQITAATNIPLGVVSLFAALWLWRRRDHQPLKASLWAGMFGGLMVASDLGVFAHGLKLEPETVKFIWHVIYAALAITVACFAAGALCDGWGAGTTRRLLPGLMALGAGFYCYATFWSASFLPFIVYEGVATLFSLAVYVMLAVQGRLAGARWMVAGTAITILAATLQATRAVTYTLGVPFDHNGVFHLVQLPGLLCLLAGLRRSLAAGARAASDPCPLPLPASGNEVVS
jgi:hypothetical protein